MQQPSQNWQPLSPYPPSQERGAGPPWGQPPPKKSRRRLWIILAIIGGVLVLSCSIFGVVGAMNPQPNQAAQPTQAPTVAIATPTLAPTATATSTPSPTATPQPTIYPPKTEADLRSLAAQGDASRIHEFHSESVGLTGACPQPKREVTVDSSVTGQQLAEDLLAYFYAQQLDSPCGSLVLAYHHQSEANDVYTAGRILFDAADSSGSPNVDPNASNLTYTLTLDVGGDFTGQEYVVTY